MPSELVSASLVVSPVIETLRRHSALRFLVGRAVFLFVLLRIVVTVAKVENPVGMIVLMTVLGAIDTRRRGEFALWSNLGYDRWMTWALYGSVALIGEIIVSAVRAAFL
ncbi:MAG: hypothetical protein ABI852_02260 [Gemmatimonadaceae bacterium]